jgi:hypothetical protein
VFRLELEVIAYRMGMGMVPPESPKYSDISVRYRTGMYPHHRSKMSLLVLYILKGSLDLVLYSQYVCMY